MLVKDKLSIPNSAKFKAQSSVRFIEEDGHLYVTSIVKAKKAYGQEMERRFIVMFRGGNMDSYEVAFDN